MLVYLKKVTFCSVIFVLIVLVEIMKKPEVAKVVLCLGGVRG